jgi:hypothetical protein
MYLAHKYYEAENKRWPIPASNKIYSNDSITLMVEMLCKHYDIKDSIYVFTRYSDDETSWYDPAHHYDFMVLCWAKDKDGYLYINLLTVVHEFAHFAEEYKRRKSRKPHSIRCHGKAHREIVDESIRFLNMWGWWGRLV